MVSWTIGMPCAGVKAGGDCLAPWVRGGANAEPIVSEPLPEPDPDPEAEPAPGGSGVRPAGMVNSEVGWSSSDGVADFPPLRRDEGAARLVGLGLLVLRTALFRHHSTSLLLGCASSVALVPSMGTDMGAHAKRAAHR